MSKDYFLKDDGSFVIKKYNSRPPFSNFLPGIAGVWGVPMWVFYVNRGQGIASFGIEDKDHPIVEFYPANKAYSFVSYLGFRTFLKINNQAIYEPFRFACDEEEMVTRSASFEIRQSNVLLGLEIAVRYFTIPGVPVGALARVVTIKNTADKETALEILDGLPRIAPFGINNFFLKEMARTIEAWMRSGITDNQAIFRLIVDAKDVSQTRSIEGANFNCSFYENEGKKIFPYLVVDPDAVFGYDTSCHYPLNFFDRKFEVPLSQITSGKTPCAFSYFNWQLKPGESKVFYSIFGAAFKAEKIEKFTSRLNSAFLKEKEQENEAIIEEIKNQAFCVSDSREFNNYVKSSYLDNVLRGGYPCYFPKNTYYVFSRKHGDLERDYNRFKLLPSYFSEGEANYRDINQNRRMDLFFNPFIERKNVDYFLNLIKIDGYNPLIVKGEKLFFSENGARSILKEFKIKNKELIHLMSEGFRLGDIFRFLEEQDIVLAEKEAFTVALVEKAGREPAASFGEGFWIDHWRYNLDLIENFLYFYPDKLKDLFLAREQYYWDDDWRVKDRKFRYQLKEGKVYQWHCIEEVKDKKTIIAKRDKFKNFLRTKKGEVYRTHLLEKLLSLILNKSASLDPCGIGVEMEADKPGWCDSLNGLPALFGSSLCETLEIKRACFILLDAVKQFEKQEIRKVSLAKEIYDFLADMRKLLDTYRQTSKKTQDYLWWDESNSVKESFRKKTFYYIEGRKKDITLEELAGFLNKLVLKLNDGISKARDKNSGVISTYFSYAVKKYEIRDEYIFPVKFAGKSLPLFLEGPVHALRVEKDKSIYAALVKSGLFDQKLKMYRLNDSLQDEPLEIGRSRVFVPGWLENESIWLHMEYKYLLEILKNNLYEEFFRDFYNCAVCFFDPEIYGRSILENSSFIASSANPDSNLWGKGFVARLSGATVELINIWVLMCLGVKPFQIDPKHGFCLKFSPILKNNLFTAGKQTIRFRGKSLVFEENTFAFALFSTVLVVYHNPQRKDTVDCQVDKISIVFEGKRIELSGSIIPLPYSVAVREREVERIDVYLKEIQLYKFSGFKTRLFRDI